MLVRSPHRWSVAVRRPDGTVHVSCEVTEDRWPRLRKTVLRGPVALVDAVTTGMRAIAIATRESTGADVGSQTLAVVFVPVLVGALGLFVALPGMLTGSLSDPAADIVEASGRALMLLIYLAALARGETSVRMFRYHGAEHMAIAAFERHGRVPTMDEARSSSPIHVRCGTDFIAIFVIACGVVFSFVPRDPVWAAGAYRVALVPVVAAAAYEAMRAGAGAQGARWARALTAPGRALQRITTRPPGDGELEVALAALSATVEP